MSDPLEQLETVMADLAKSIVADVTKPDVHVESKIEAMKVLTAYRTALNKHPPKKGTKSEDELSFDDFAQEMGTRNGKTRHVDG